MPFMFEELPVGVTKKRYIAMIIVQSIILGLGLIFLILGGLITWMAIGVDIVTGLEVILVFSASFVVGFQLISIALCISPSSEFRLTPLNDRLSEFAHLTAALIWIFGIWTYVLSWPIETQIVREMLVASSTFVSLWAGSLFVIQSYRVRILTDVMLLGGIAISLNIWFSLANMTLLILGGIVLCSVLIHLLLVCVHPLVGGHFTPPTYKPDSKHAEEAVEQTL